MKIIEGMKKIKTLTEKAADLRKKIQTFCADLDFETPTYGTPEDQRSTVSGWLQAHSDVLKEILHLRVSIQRTNILTPVTIMFGDRSVTKSIAEWIHRRRDLAALEMSSWQMLTDRGLKEGVANTTAGGVKEVRIRRYYDPKLRDAALDLYRSEPATIDSSLEVVNAVTDLIES